MIGSEEQIVNHDFNINKLVEVDPLTENAAKKAIAMVWNKNIGTPTTFNLIFTSRLTHPDSGEDTGSSEEYDPDMDTFKFAMETMAERLKFGLSQDETIIMVAAHSVMHKVQFARGENPRPSPKTPEMDEQYFNDPHEKEAWLEAMHVFKKVYPKATGHFTTGGVKYTIPKKSKY